MTIARPGIILPREYSLSQRIEIGRRCRVEQGLNPGNL